MPITCPQCETSYQVSAEAIGKKGRSVKCVRCGNVWHARMDQEKKFESVAIAPSEQNESQAQRANIPNKPNERPSRQKTNVPPAQPAPVEPAQAGPVEKASEIATIAQAPSIEPDLPIEGINVAPIAQMPDGAQEGEQYVPREQMQSDAEQLVQNVIDQAKNEAASSAQENIPAQEQSDDVTPVIDESYNEEELASAWSVDTASQSSSDTELATDELASTQQVSADLEDEQTNNSDISQEGSEILAGVSQAMMDVDQHKKSTMGLGVRSPKVKLVQSSEKKRHLQQNFLGICAFLIAACILIGAGVFREVIVKTMPESASIYSTLGMDVNLRGLDFVDVRTQNDFENGVPILIVSGTIVNVDEARVDLPNVRLALRSASGREVYAWSYDPTVNNLEAGGRITFSTRVASPPEGASDIQLRFVGAE